VRADGAVIGTIGGGLLEARTQEAGRRALADNQMQLLELRLDSRDLAADGMVCGGSVDVVVAPWHPEQAPLARDAATMLDGASSGVLLLAWKDDGASWELDLWRDGAWLRGGEGRAELDGPLAEAGRSDQPQMTGEATAGWVLEPLRRQRTPLLILGAGHVGRALARVAATADFEVTVVDDRPEFANPEHIPWAERVGCRPFPGVLEELAPDIGTFVVICTRGHLSDTDCTEQALATPAPYVGVIGSRRKRGLLLDHLRALGITEERLQVLHMPVGLSIGAETPEEIAVSVVAEMIQERSNSK
jgi:xanthine dehydrogenase accessory factor